MAATTVSPSRLHLIELSVAGLVGICSFLSPADLASLSRSCAAMRFVPSHSGLWADLCRRRFPGKMPPPDGHWKRAYHSHLMQEKRVAGYQRDMMLGLLGRRQGPPAALSEPMVDAFSLDGEGGSRPLHMMATRRMRARLRDERALEEAATVSAAASCGAATVHASASDDAGSAARSGAGAAVATAPASTSDAPRPLPADAVTVVRRGVGDLNEDVPQDKRQLRIRQGSAPWSALR